MLRNNRRLRTSVLRELGGWDAWNVIGGLTSNGKETLMSTTRTTRNRPVASAVVLATIVAALFLAATALAAPKPQHRHATCASISHIRLHGPAALRCNRARASVGKARNGVWSTNGPAPAGAIRSSTTRFPSDGSTTAGQPLSSAVSGSLIVGVNASLVGWSDLSARVDQVASATGATWVRQAFLWSTIEPSPGVFSWGYYDSLVLLAAEHGIHLLPLLLDTPSWEGSNYEVIPSDPSAYAGYTAAVVERYGPHGSLWTQYPRYASYAIHTFELWSEPYYDNGNDGDYNPAAYANLVKAAGTAGHAADPSAKFLLAAENQCQLVGSNFVWWIDALYRAVPDLNNYFDGVAVHPYGNDLTDLTFPAPEEPYTGYEQIRRVEDIRQEFVNQGAADKPLWITEIGWPTCTSGSDRCTTLAGQASDLQTVFNYAHTTWSSYVQAVFVYNFDDAGTDSSDPENDYGLAYNNGSPKPALAVLKANET